MRTESIHVLVLLVAVLGCQGPSAADEAPPEVVQVGAAPVTATPARPVLPVGAAPGTTEPAPEEVAAAPVTEDEPPPRADLPGLALEAAGDIPEEDRVLVVLEGHERIFTRAQAAAEGYTLLSLRDDWTPYIFQPKTDAGGDELPNRYRRIFVGLANDKMDSDGRKLEEEEDNYLEVFGIPPSLGILHQRYMDDEGKACNRTIDYDFIGRHERVVQRSEKGSKKYAREREGHQKKVDAAMAETGAATLDALRAQRPKLSDSIDFLQKGVGEGRVLAEVEKRLECDGHNHPRYKHKAGEMDQGLRLALRRFQRKHKIYEHTNLRGETMKLLGMRPIQTNHLDLVRALTERVVDATGILEDGTYPGDTVPTYTGSDGQQHPLRNLVEEFTQAALTQLRLDTPERALAFMKRHKAHDFRWMVAGVKFPALPEYYQPHMNLEVVIDRGDVFYDPPWDEKGRKRPQYRKRLPKYSLFTTWHDQRIRLVYWPTTIGGWRAEVAKNGYEYYAYKQSYVGERVIKQVIAGPTWVPPETTPLGALAKRRYINGKTQGVVNYSEMGPSYLSAYGLVAGYFTTRNGGDQGIRVHGSSDYMSILSPERFSHGCHRLMNHHAVRLYGHILRHRKMTVDGDQDLNHTRQFYWEGEVYQVRLPTRGFKYTLDPPLPVTVEEGNIRGRRNSPIEGLVKIPDTRYPQDEDEPEDPVAPKPPEAPEAPAPENFRGEDVRPAVPVPALPALPAPTQAVPPKKDKDA